MPSKWRSTSMREAVEFFSSGDPFLKLEYAASGIPVLAKGDVKPFGRLEHGEKRYIDITLAARRAYRKTRPGDYLLTTRDLTQAANFLGLLAPIPEDREYLVNQGANVIRFSEKVDGRFLVYWCNGPLYRSYIKGHYVGSTQIHIRKEDFLDAPLWLPSIGEQRAITHILGTLDDKIELNRNMNRTLEAMARAIFKSWFVDFDPVRAKTEGRDPDLPPNLAAFFPDSFVDSELGEIPKGWTIKAVADFADLNSWTLSKSDHLDRIEYIEISEVSKGNIGTIQTFKRGEEPSRARRRLRHGDTLLSTVRPERGSYFLCLQPSANLVASTGFAVFTPTKAPWSLLHASLTQSDLFERLGQLADGGAYPAVRPEVIGNWQLPWPDNINIAEAFHCICGPLYEKAEHNRCESRTLVALRDALLPKLLSGEIRVNGTEVIYE